MRKQQAHNTSRDIIQHHEPGKYAKRLPRIVIDTQRSSNLCLSPFPMTVDSPVDVLVRTSFADVRCDFQVIGRQLKPCFGGPTVVHQMPGRASLVGDGFGRPAAWVARSGIWRRVGRFRWLARVGLSLWYLYMRT
jgi:hypothetical protein